MKNQRYLVIHRTDDNKHKHQRKEPIRIQKITSSRLLVSEGGVSKASERKKEGDWGIARFARAAFLRALH